MAIRLLLSLLPLLTFTSAQNSGQAEENALVEETPKGATLPQEDTATPPQDPLSSPEDDHLTIKLTPEWKDKGASYYLAPKGATRGVKGISIPYTLWYDGYKWTESDPLNVYAEKSFTVEGKSIYAIVVVDSKPFSLNDIDSVVIENAKKSGFEHADVLSLEKRNVNGVDVIFVHWAAKLQNVHIDFLSYLYSNATGSVFIHTYTPTMLFKKNRRDMEDFLNGFTLNIQAGIEKDSE